MITLNFQKYKQICRPELFAAENLPHVSHTLGNIIKFVTTKNTIFTAERRNKNGEL